MKNIKKLKDPGSAITHFIGMIMALFAATPLLIRATHEPDTIHVVSLAVFIVSMILLYAASTAYHSFNLSARANLILKKIDHMMIFVLIAGTYTPMCLIVLHGKTGFFFFFINFENILSVVKRRSPPKKKPKATTKAAQLESVLALSIAGFNSEK